MPRRSLIYGLAASALVAGGAGVAIGADVVGPHSRDTPAAVAPAAGPTNVGAPHQISSAALRAHLERAGAEYVAGTRWDSAVSFAVPATQLRGWTFANADGRRCLALPDPLVEGYGVTCKTDAEVTRGRATVVVMPPDGTGAPVILGALTTKAGETRAEAPANGGQVRSIEVAGAYVASGPLGTRLITPSGAQAATPPRYDLAPQEAGK